MPWFFFFRPARILTVLLSGRVLLALAFVFGPTLAFSQTVPPSYSYYMSAGGKTYYGSTPADVCSNAMNGAGSGAYYAAPNTSTGQCMMTYNGTTSAWGPYYGVTSQAQCVSGYTYQNGACVSPVANCPSAGKPAPGGNTAYGTSSTQTVTNPAVCINSCSYGYSSYWTGAQPGQTGGYATEWYGLTSNYAACSGSGVPNALDSKPTSSCPDKTYSGTVNGQNVCVPYPTQTTGGTTSSTTTDAPASGTAASNTSNTSTSTTCDGATCTTTTVVTGGGSGGSGGAASGTAAGPCQTTQVSTGGAVNGGAGTCTTTTSQPQTDYCKQNPTAQQCKASQGSASGGADCTAPPTCDGDAISCAILAQQWSTRCDLQKSQDPSVQLGQQIQSGNDPMASQLPTPGKADASPVSMADKFSSVDNMGVVEQCLQPIGFSVFGFSYSFDTGPLCKLGQVLGMLNVMGTLMLCAYMLKGSF